MDFRKRHAPAIDTQRNVLCSRKRQKFYELPHFLREEWKRDDSAAQEISQCDEYHLQSLRRYGEKRQHVD